MFISAFAKRFYPSFSDIHSDTKGKPARTMIAGCHTTMVCFWRVLALLFIVLLSRSHLVSRHWGGGD